MGDPAVDDNDTDARGKAGEIFIEFQQEFRRKARHEDFARRLLRSLWIVGLHVSALDCTTRSESEWSSHECNSGGVSPPT